MAWFQMTKIVRNGLDPMERQWTVREHLAAMAMQGLCANPASWAEDYSNVATIAFEYADAMLAHQESED